MGKSYKEELANFKQFRLDPENFKRTHPKSKKVKPYKVTGMLGILNRELLIGRYATPQDAEKAMKAAMKSGYYKEVKCEPAVEK